MPIKAVWNWMLFRYIFVHSEYSGCSRTMFYWIWPRISRKNTETTIIKMKRKKMMYFDWIDWDIAWYFVSLIFFETSAQHCFHRKQSTRGWQPRELSFEHCFLSTFLSGRVLSETELRWKMFGKILGKMLSNEFFSEHFKLNY